MADLIDRETLISSLDELKYCYIPEAWSAWEEKPSWYAHEVADIVENLPTVDAVEVVRCKNCRHRGIVGGGYRWCEAWSRIQTMGDDGFCNFGERREDDG